ncbi:hypothetical protein T440DRAFT_512019 [Plenodomus tracheiphilus IPT5]|uniref:Uncharacterized protein n=1 Tax=Plenodomus tracheiphilus IPT5 TaxID=1408161 RepID=A0A6A7APV9_9PLEO|nr:hypothetical protein T440DRAFT_512019 [Plenodomus tracheiphilus IPT5]
MDNVRITEEQPSYKAVFGLDIVTAAIALILLGLATRPTFQRIKAGRFSSLNGAQDEPFKTTLGTYLFLWPALLCFSIVYIVRCASDILKTRGIVDYDKDLSWNGRAAYTVSSNENGTRLSALTFTTAFTNILFTVLLNGGVWIHSSHVQSNGTGTSSPKKKSKIWNTFIMLMILATGVAAWGVGMDVRDMSGGTMGRLAWSDVLVRDRVTRILYIVYECTVIVSSTSVSIEVWREYNSTNRTAHQSNERNHLARFAFVVVPLIALRNIFIILDIILLYLDTSNWPTSASLAVTFLLLIFRQFANLAIVAIILWGAWRMGRTIKMFGGSV